MCRTILHVALFVSVITASIGTCIAQEFLLADGNSWPGKILQVRGFTPTGLWQRNASASDHHVPRLQSLAALDDGRLVFCSGLDRAVMALDSGREIELHFGGGLVRQVRAGGRSEVYWSGLETPQGTNPLPDGFIYRQSLLTGQAETVCTFSQSLVDRDWWGAFDVHQGQIYVMTLHQPSKLYVLENSIPRLLATLPISATAFRVGEHRSLQASDGQGKLYRFSDYQDPSRHEIMLDLASPFVDFLVRP